MRSSKYHDYRVLKIALFIILVILGLFIYIKCTRALHEHTAPANQWTVLKEATCTENGLKCKICTDDCGEEFDHEVIPATGHTESKKWTTVKSATCTEQGRENLLCADCGEVLDTRFTDKIAHNKTTKYEIIEEATCTESGSKYEIVYCKVCTFEHSKIVVSIAPKGHSYGAVIDTQITEPTHTEIGYKIDFSQCSGCGETHPTDVEEIAPIGHTYTWELKYSESGEFTMAGTCDCDEIGNEVIKSASNGLVIETDGVPNCCIHRYIGKITVDGEEIVREIILENEPHKIHRVEIANGLDGEKYAYVPITDFASQDEYGDYYDITNEELKGYIFRYVDADNSNEWDENGFALGIFECAQCIDMECSECNGKYWHVVRIYNPNYDTRLNNNVEIENT